LGKGYLSPIQAEHLGTILKAEFTLDQEGPELSRVRAIEGGWFTDFGTGGGGLVGPVGRAGEAIEGDG